MTTSLGRAMASAIVCTVMSTAALAVRPMLRIAVQQVTTNGTLTPLREQSNVGSRVFPMIYANLIEPKRQGDLSLQPSLASAWKRIDERTVELKLRRGVKFHNGDEMTAEDVAFSFGPEHMFAATAPLRAGQETRTIPTDASTTGALPAGKALELPHVRECA